MNDSTKTWIVYLQSGESVIVQAQWVEDKDDGYVRFGYGYADMSYIVAKFIEDNISGYRQAGGAILYGEAPRTEISENS